MENNIAEVKEEYIAKYSYEEAEEVFKGYGINYDIESVVYLKRKGMSFSEMIDYDDYNTIFFIASGLGGVALSGEESNENRAIKLIKDWQKKGYTLKMLWTLAYLQAKEVNGFFTNKDEIMFMTEAMKRAQDEISKAVIYVTTVGRNTLEETGEN